MEGRSAEVADISGGDVGGGDMSPAPWPARYIIVVPLPQLGRALHQCGPSPRPPHLSPTCKPPKVKGGEPMQAPEGERR